MIATKKIINWNNPVFANPDTAPQYGVTALYGKGYGSQRLLDIRGKYHGTLTNGPTWTKGKFGEPAISFNGSTTYTLGSPVLSAVPVSMVCWFNSNAITSDSTLMLHGANSSRAPSNDYYALLARSTAVNGNKCTAIANNWSPGAAAVVNGATSYSAGVWNHAALVASANNSLVLYFNGENDGSSSTTVNVAYWDKLEMGRWAPGATTPGIYLDGKLANASVHNKALTPAQISELYRNPFLLYWQPSPKKIFFFRQITAVPRRARVRKKVRRLAVQLP